MSQESLTNQVAPADSVQGPVMTNMTVTGEANLSGNDAEHSEHKCAQYAGQSAEREDAETHQGSEEVRQSAPLVTEPELASAVNALAQVALQMDDPVQALEDGVEALAEALVERQIAAQQREDQQRSLEQQRETNLAELQDAYRHARLHRVGELVDVGYSLDQAIAITNANAAEIHQRSQAAGRDPNAVIYEYAVRHGYQPRSMREKVSSPQERRRTLPAPTRSQTVLEKLAGLSDEAFAQATQGDRWERLLKVR